MKRWLQSAIRALAAASLIGAPAFAKDEIEGLPRIHMSRLSPEDIAPQVQSLRPKQPGATQRDGLLCMKLGRTHTTIGSPESYSASAPPMTPLTWGVTLISISVILLTCALLLEELLRRRFRGHAERNLVGPLQKRSEIFWGAGVTIATLFVVTMWTMLSVSATPAGGARATREASGYHSRLR